MKGILQLAALLSVLLASSPAVFAQKGKTKGSPKAKTASQSEAKPSGVINSRATNFVTPDYPAAARAVRATGAVNVSVTIDQTGKVVAAQAVSGHPLLRKAAEDAARESEFKPFTAGGKPVEGTGMIVYNFVPGMVSSASRTNAGESAAARADNSVKKDDAAEQQQQNAASAAGKADDSNKAQTVSGGLPAGKYSCRTNIGGMIQERDSFRIYADGTYQVDNQSNAAASYSYDSNSGAIQWRGEGFSRAAKSWYDAERQIVFIRLGNENWDCGIRGGR